MLFRRVAFIKSLYLVRTTLVQCASFYDSTAHGLRVTLHGAGDVLVPSPHYRGKDMCRLAIEYNAFTLRHTI